RRGSDRLGARRLRGRPDHPASGALGVRSIHEPGPAARLPRARGAPRAGLHHHLRCPVRAAGGAGARRGRDGRLQHLLRDPVLRQAGPARAAHRAAPGAVSARRARQPARSGARAAGRSGPRAGAHGRAAARDRRVAAPAPGADPRPARRARADRRARGALARRQQGALAPALRLMAARADLAAARRRVAVVVKGYPRLSETFIAQEILGLERRGLALTIVSLRHPTDPAVHPMHREIGAPVLYLPEYLYQEPQRVLRAWRAVRRLPTYRAARRLWLRDLERDRTSNRGRRFGQAL